MENNIGIALSSVGLRSLSDIRVVRTLIKYYIFIDLDILNLFYSQFDIIDSL